MDYERSPSRDLAGSPSLGVAFSGGGAAGMAHIGVLDELLAAGLSIHCVAGTSAGALVAGAFASGRLGELAEALTTISWRSLWGLFGPTWPRLGLFEGRGGLDLVRPCLADRIEDLPMPYAAIATDLHSGEEVAIESGSLIEAVRASAAIPGVFTPRVIDGRTLVDGGLVNPLPVNVVRRLGGDVVIASSLFALTDQDVAPSVVDAHREMGIFEILAQSSTVVQARLASAQLCAEPPDVVIVPQTADVGTFDLHRCAEAIEAGRLATRAALPAIRAALRRSEEQGFAARDPLGDHSVATPAWTPPHTADAFTRIGVARPHRPSAQSTGL